ncbi:MAG: hypothetical protein JWN35_591 [Frankiales bacterium]|nr:hypothetical protein [Frankiales bacterium]
MVDPKPGRLVIKRARSRCRQVRHKAVDEDRHGDRSFAGGRDDVLKLTLHPNGYDFQYVADPSTPFTDKGSGTCH